MFDLSLAEMGVIALAAVIFIGPKELPVVVRTVSGWLRALKNLASEIRRALEGLAEEAELRGLKDELSTPMPTIIDLEGTVRETYDLSDMVGDRPSSSMGNGPVGDIAPQADKDSRRRKASSRVTKVPPHE